MRTKKKSFLGILLSLALIIGMMPAMGLNMTAYARATLTVKGIPVTGENMSDVLNDGGTVSLDPDTNTLTLKGANITTGEYDGILYLGNEPLTIELAEGTESTINMRHRQYVWVTMPVN